MLNHPCWYQHEQCNFKLTLLLLLFFSFSHLLCGVTGTERLGEIVSNLRETSKVNFKDPKDTMFAPASPEACALEIMRGTTMREREIYFPPTQYIRFVVLFRELIVRLAEPLGLSQMLN